MTQVFISYSRTDMDFVQQLAKDLETAGFDVWWDLTDIQGSEVWERKIEEGLRTSQYFIVVLTPASLESRWVRREYLSADNSGIRIIPLRLKPYDVTPLALRDIQPIDAIDRKYEDVLSDVVTTLKNSSPNLVGRMSSKEKEENTSLSAPMGLLELGGLIFPILYFILAGLDALGLLEAAEVSIMWGVSAILTVFYFFFRRRIVPGLPTKISLIIFLMAHSVVSYGDFTGRDLTILPSIVEGLVALIIAGLLLVNLRTPQRPAPYSSIMFGVFLLLVGLKILLNQMGSYPNEIYTLIILSGIVTSIVLWLDQ